MIKKITYSVTGILCCCWNWRIHSGLRNVCEGIKFILKCGDFPKIPLDYMYNYMYNWRFFIIAEIELPKASEDKVYRLFLDPTGKHLIICMESTENLYLSRNSRKPRSIGKLKVRVQCTCSLSISEWVKPNSCGKTNNNSVPNSFICTRFKFSVQWVLLIANS